MGLTEKLDLLMAEKGLNRREFSVQSGIPYMTIVNFYNKGTENVKLSTLKKIAAYFGVSLDYIADDSVLDRGDVASVKHCYTPDEMAIMEAYRRASDDDRMIVDTALRKYMSADYLKRDIEKMA